MSPTFAVGRPMLLAVLAALGAGTLAASEIGALHLAFDKPVSMRRVEATLYLTYQSRSVQGEPREVSCAVIPAGARGRLSAKGRMRLRLLGDGPDAPWESGAITESLDNRGEARFAAAEIATLASEAPNDARIELFELLLSGGKGKKVATLTIDCAQASVAE